MWNGARGGPERRIVPGGAMKQLAMISYAITAAGVLMLAIAIVAGLSPLWQLTGAMLVLAGGVKIAVVQIWQRLAGL